MVSSAINSHSTLQVPEQGLRTMKQKGVMFHVYMRKSAKRDTAKRDTRLYLHKEQKMSRLSWTMGTDIQSSNYYHRHSQHQKQ